MNSIIVFDADNTLWDTDGVFKNAQKALLQKLADVRQGLQHFSKSLASPEDQFISVGDSLKRDIKFGNQAGFLTIYKPANFMGTEEPTDKDEEPAFKIQSLDELPLLLEGMGIVKATEEVKGIYGDLSRLVIEKLS